MWIDLGWVSLQDSDHLTVCWESPVLESAEPGEQPRATINLPQPSDGGSSKQPTVLPKWTLICFSEHLNCCSFVHSLGNRSREFYKTERNFEVIRARPFIVKLRPLTFHWNQTVSWTWQLTWFKRLGSLFRNISQPGGVFLLCDLSLKCVAWHWVQVLMLEWESIKP